MDCYAPGYIAVPVVNGIISRVLKDAVQSDRQFGAALQAQFRNGDIADLNIAGKGCAPGNAVQSVPNCIIARGAVIYSAV